jgi:hypothetical protein
LICAFAFTTQPQKTSRGRFGFPTLRVR